ncbi:MAG TPA: M20/M25/M40 family metallo-hydrolase, partial [Longimicrobiales bacterium]|nr:M20/M25/M40 family metallo-hydrolase [Longimicrobiales bacterium]
SLVRADIRTEADLVFVGTVGEEGLGDLRGARHLFRANAPRIDSFIAVDATTDEEITNTAIGSKRYRVTFSGPGGHSWSAFGNASPISALGRAIHLFDDAAARFTSSGAASSYNIGRIGGGTSVNAIAVQAWAEVDMRSESLDRLNALDSIFHNAMVNALNEQNAIRTSGPELTLEARVVGNRPPGTTDPSSPIVQRAMAIARALNLTPRLEGSSTDANVAIGRGIPAITIGRGGISAKNHSPVEYWINSNGTRGIRRILYTVLAEAGLKT